MRSLRGLLVLALGLAVLAPARAPAQGTPVPRGALDERSGRIRLSRQDVPVLPDTLTATPALAWQALGVVYSTLDIPESVVDTNAHILGAYRVTRRKPIAGVRLSRFLECGQGQYGPNADYNTVQLTALSSVEALPNGGVAIGTRVSGTSSSNVGSVTTCSSTGALEQRIVAELRKLLPD